ncbi:HupE/UreJ family protein [Methylomonas sp. AM2-LC]|uniref:HupE/UreJ family protein n=1 Tax=Methylomonas sp. AM2-LC TaxID=3153301 RepID=UPI00326631BE
MSATLISKSSDTGSTPYRVLLSVALPILLLAAFLGRQIIDLDSIGLNNGFNHPLTGWDHLLTMLAVGIWAAQLRGQAIWMLPLAFVGVMSLGGLAGASGICIPSVEGIILLSSAVFSVLITRKVRFSSKVNVLIVAFFAFFHGFAHGQEISTSASLISYTLGFMLATLLLHGAGILLAKLVVLSLSFLLTLMFSTSALAITTLEFAQQNLISASSTFSLERAQNAVKGAVNSGQISESVSKSVSYNSAATPLSISACSAVFSETLIVLVLLPFQTIVNISYRYIFNSGLHFKHFFPDINQSPGRHLLSNGVGVTSPPALFNAISAIKITSALYSGFASIIAAQSLQLANTFAYLSKFSTKVKFHPFDNFALFFGFYVNIINPASTANSTFPDKVVLCFFTPKSQRTLQLGLG